MENVRLPVYITYDGNVTYAFPIKYDVTCMIDISQFPFDNQECYLSVNTWSYARDKLRIVPNDDTELIMSLYQVGVCYFVMHMFFVTNVFISIFSRFCILRKYLCAK